MTRNNLLALVLAAADDVGRIFDHTEIQTWPAGSLEVLRRLGLLRPAAVGLHAPCPNCDDGHVEPVIVRAGTGDTKRYFISCPETLRVEVQPEMCNGWEVDRVGLAAAVAAALAMTATPKPVVPERFWRLGRTPWPPGSGQTREVVLAVRLHEPDAPTIAAHVGPGGRAIVLVPQHAPGDRLWSDPVPAVVPLAQILTLGDAGLIVDATAVVEIVRAADERAKKADAVALGPTGKKLVRRQLKAEIKSMLTDDAYVAAYKEHHSFRKAADALTKQTGQPVSKDAVRRAVERHGGIADVIPEDDSSSVARTVASQRRDRAEKIVQRR